MKTTAKNLFLTFIFIIGLLNVNSLSALEMFTCDVHSKHTSTEVTMHNARNKGKYRCLPTCDEVCIIKIRKVEPEIVMV